MLENPENRAKLDSLKDWKDENREFEVYQLFQENGYGKDFESFRIELRAFLNSDEIVKIFESDGNELPEEVLESVAGGFGVKHAVITGLTSLVLACTGAVTLSPIISDLGKANDVSVSSEVKDDNGDSGSKFDDWDRNSDEKDKDEIKGFEKGPKGERAKDLNRSDRKKSDRKNRGWILREAQKKHGPRGGGSGRVHKFDDLTGRQNRLMASNVFESSRNTGEAAKSRANFSNTSSKRKAGDNNQNAQNVNIEVPSVTVNTNPSIPTPPPPPPPVPMHNAANAPGGKHAANAQAKPKSMADEIAEKKKEFDKKREENKNKNNNNQNAQAKPKLTLKQIAENFNDIEGNRGLNGSITDLGRKNNDLSNKGVNIGDAGRLNFSADDILLDSKNSKESLDLSHEGSQPIDEHSSLKFDSSSDSSQQNDSSEDSILSLSIGKKNENQRRFSLLANKVKGLGENDADYLNRSVDDILVGNKDFKGMFLNSEEPSLDSKESFKGNKSMFYRHNKAHSEDSFDSLVTLDSLFDSSQKDGSGLDDSILSLSFGKKNADQMRARLFENKSKGLNKSVIKNVVDKLNRTADDIGLNEVDSEEPSLDSEELFVGNKSMFYRHNKAHSEDPFDLNLSAIDKNDEGADLDMYDDFNFTFADLGDKNKNKNNNNQNAQNVNIEVPSVTVNTNPSIPAPPPPPPPVPKINGANANVNVPQKSQAQELAEKKLELDKKRAEKGNNEENNKLKEVKALVEKVLVSNGKAEIRKAVEELREKIEKNENKDLTLDELIKAATKDLNLNDVASVAVKIRNYFLNVHENIHEEDDNEIDDDWD